MVNRILLRKAGRDLYERKGSLLALSVIVTIGVGCFIGSAAVWRDLDQSRSRYYREYRIADFSVNVKRAPPQALETVESLPNVRAVYGRISLAALVDIPGVETPIGGVTISLPAQQTPVLNGVMLRSGAWFSGPDEREVILNDEFAKANGLYPGCRIKVLLLDKQHDLLVVGTAMSPEFVYMIPSGGGLAPDPARFGVMYLAEDFLRRSCDLEGAYNEIVGQVHDRSRNALGRTLTLIEERLDAYGVTNAIPIHEQASVKFLEDEMTGLEVSSTIVPGIFLLVAALVLNVLLGRLVTQQRTVIGTLKALGYSNAAITRHYLFHALTIGAAGGLFGCGFGYWLEGAFISIYREIFALPSIQRHFYPDILVQGFAISIVFAVLGTLRAIQQASRLQPAEAMRPPAPEKGGRTPLEYIPAFWHPLPFRWKMAVRAVFRNPFRSLVNIIAGAISTAIIFMALGNSASLSYLMEYQFEKISHEDFTVSLRDPQPGDALREIESLPFVAETEPQLSVNCDLRHGPYKKRAGISGLPRNNRLNTPLDRLGRPIIIPDAGIVLSKELARILGAAPGSTLQLRPLTGRRKTVSAPVTGIVDTYLGLSAYADIEYLSGIIGEEWAANSILGISYGGALHLPLLTALKQRPGIVAVGERTRSLHALDEAFGESMGAMISVMILFAGVIAFGSVLNSALVSVSERQRETGTLRVLGYTPEQVAKIFSGECYMLYTIGILLGLGLGILLTHALAAAYSTELYRFPVVIRMENFIWSALLMLFFIAVAQRIVRRLIRKLPWLEVLEVKE